ncbi:hypothetical protein ONS96_000190 [Cadophora gregata f. sp. sojae]|nr:hypothetical protein ONS96_000190 [Cadophora gregata f. sp. sojae]
MAATYQSKALSTKTGDFECKCSYCQYQEGEICQRKWRMQEHGRKVTCIVSECPEIVNILVSPNEDLMTCHRAVLCFYSEFFDAAFYGGLKEATEGVIRLPEESKIQVAAFLGWVYSGQIHSEESAEELWMLGDRLRSPEFANEAMYFMMDMYGASSVEGGRWLSPASLELAFSGTMDGSKLQLFARDLMKTHGPLCPRAVDEEACFDSSKAYEKDWHEFINKGGELAVIMATEVGFFHDYMEFESDAQSEPAKAAPYEAPNHVKYMLTVTSRALEEFVQGKKRSRAL